MKRNRNGISLFLKRKIAFFETENHWPYIRCIRKRYDRGGAERRQHNKQGSIEEEDNTGDPRRRDKPGMRKKMTIYFERLVVLPYNWPIFNTLPLLLGML